MVKFVMKHIGDDELMDDMFDAKQGTDMVPMIKSAMKRLNIAEEVECDCDCGKSPCEKCGQDHHGIAEEVSFMDAVKEQLAKIKGNTPGDQGRRGAVEDDIERAKNKGDDKLVKKLKEDDIDEGFSSKEIKMAIGVASDKRYAGGNMTGAVDAIDKIKKGLSDHPQVAAVLRRQNEEVELDEASKEGTIKIIKTKDGKFQIQKMTKGKFVDMGKPYNSAKEAEKFRSGQPDLFGEASAAADARRSISKDRDFGRKRDSADKDDVASDDDVKAASKNIMMQLRKSVNRASRGVEFGDKKKVQVDPKIAQAVISKYNSLRRPSDKEIFQAKIAKSYKDMLKALKESTIKESKFGIINKQLKGEK
jgi:hypothetical protein